MLKKIPITFGKTELGIVPFNPVLKADETTYRVDFKGVYMPNEFSESLLEHQLQLNGPAMAAMMKVGMRVVRGKDWKYGDQDKGGMGTVTYVAENINKDWVKVKWDHGTETPYKMGVENSCELKLVETHNSVQQDTE